MYQAPHAAPECQSLNLEEEKVKLLQQAMRPKITRKLVGFIAYFGDTESKALSEFRSFLLEVYDNIFGTFTRPGRAQATEADEDARTVLFLLIRSAEGDSITTYVQYALDALYDMYGTRLGFAAGAPNVQFCEIFSSVARSFIDNNGWDRHEVARYAERLNQLFDCFEYPEGHK